MYQSATALRQLHVAVAHPAELPEHGIEAVSYTHLIETGRYLRRVFPAYGVRFIALTDSIDTAHDSGDDLTVSVKRCV